MTPIVKRPAHAGVRRPLLAPPFRTTVVLLFVAAVLALFLIPALVGAT